jgi:predicted Rossmann fold nucleotide-binding protein DprA/Smf involved in DNA uptake
MIETYIDGKGIPTLRHLMDDEAICVDDRQAWKQEREEKKAQLIEHLSSRKEPVSTPDLAEIVESDVRNVWSWLNRMKQAGKVKIARTERVYTKGVPTKTIWWTVPNA